MKFVGERWLSNIISANQKKTNLFSLEKSTNQEERKEVVDKYNVGDDLECEIAGIIRLWSVFENRRRFLKDLFTFQKSTGDLLKTQEKSLRSWRKSKS
ncbi:MAG: hypothetical protein R3B65_03945 [Candidatus Paceibacterota bacterium]